MPHEHGRYALPRSVRRGTRSAYADRVPGTALTVASTCSPIFSITFKSGPAILMPTGLLIPVESMSMRLRIGCTQRLESPGRVSAAFISSIN